MDRDPETVKSKKILVTIVKIAISVALLTILVISTDIQEIINALAGFNMIWIIPILLTITLSVIVSALKWGAILNAQGVSISLVRLFCYYTCGLFFNNFLPSSIGGDGARAILAGRESGTVSGAAASVVMERIIATVTLSLLGLIGAAFSEYTDPIVIILLGVLLVVGIFLALIQMTGWVPKCLRKKETRFAGIWKSFARNSAVIKEHPKKITVCFVESIIFQFTVVLVVAGVIKGLGLDMIPIMDLCMVVSASSVLAMVPVGINGYGLREGSYAYLLAPYGFSTAQSLTISVLYALFVTLFSIAGGPLWLAMRPSKSDPSPQKPINEKRKVTTA